MLRNVAPMRSSLVETILLRERAFAAGSVGTTSSAGLHCDAIRARQLRFVESKAQSRSGGLRSFIARVLKSGDVLRRDASSATF